MIPPGFRLPNVANYCLSFSDVKTLDLKELLPHFPELLPQNREKGENGACYGRILEVLAECLKK